MSTKVSATKQGVIAMLQPRLAALSETAGAA